MSLSDEFRLQRALKGGHSHETIAAELSLDDARDILRAERRYRPVDDASIIEALGDHYGIPAEQRAWHNARARSYLTHYVQHQIARQQPLSLELRHGEIVTGMPAWWDLATIGVRLADGRTLVIQRHAVVDWPDAPIWKHYNPQNDRWQNGVTPPPHTS